MNTITPYRLPPEDLQRSFYESLFEPIQAIPVRHLDFQEHITSNHDWITVLLLIILMIWGLVKMLRPKKVNQSLESFLTNRFTNQLMREEGMLSSLSNIWLLVNGVLCIGLLLSFLPPPLNLAANQISWFGFLTVAIIAFTFIRFGVHSMMNFIFNTSELGAEYIYNILLFIQAIGLLLFPLIVGITYTSANPKTLTILGLSFIGILFAIRIIKILYIGIINYRMPPLYIILYLCALELAPIFLVSKWLGLDTLIGS